MVIAMGEFNTCAGSYVLIFREVSEHLGLEDKAASLQSHSEENSKGRLNSLTRDKTLRDKHSHFPTLLHCIKKKKIGSRAEYLTQ